MARVNHKYIRRCLQGKTNTMTDRQFFTQRIFAGHLEDIAAAQTRRYQYNRRIRVKVIWDSDNEYIAGTNNLVIVINAGNPLVTKAKGRLERYWVIVGLFAHELGHVLYTDFLAMQTYNKKLSDGKWYPRKPRLTNRTLTSNESDLWDYIQQDENNLGAVLMIAHQIENVIEDGYIENRILQDFQGTIGFALEEMRKRFKDMLPTVSELIEKEDEGKAHLFQSITQVMLSYALYGEIKYGNEPMSDVRIKTVFGLLAAIDSALTSPVSRDRIAVVNEIMLNCWPYIKDFCEYCKANSLQQGSGTTASQMVSSLLQSLVGSSSIGQGSSKPVGSGKGVKIRLVTKSQRAATAGTAGLPSGSDGSEEEDENDPNSQDAQGGESEEAEETEETEAGNEADDGSELSTGDSEDESESEDISHSPSAGGGDGSKQSVSDQETDRIKLHHTDIVSDPAGGTTEYDSDYKRQKYDRAATDIERLMERMNEKSVTNELESKRLKELNQTAKSISYGDIHRGVNMRVHRISDVDQDLIDQYNDIAGPLLTISKQLGRNLVRKLQESERGGKQTGLLMGRRLDSHTLHRNDGKYFYKNNLPNQAPKIAVAYLLDESGSMSGCDRSTYARATGIILYDFCDSLNIPIMIYGHSTGSSGGREAVDLYSYAEFEAFDGDDKYRLMDISARGCNRDGAALRYVAEQLSKRPEEIKLLMLVSDGQPNGDAYSGTAAEEDLRGIVHEYNRKGIVFVAAAIGNDKPNIERIYGDAFMDISDLTQLPVKLVNVIKRNIKHII